jgi:hypothetical protein
MGGWFMPGFFMVIIVAVIIWLIFRRQPADLEQQYWTLLDKANYEACGFIAGGNGAWFHCGYNGCNHQSQWGMMRQDHHMGPVHTNRMASHMGGYW